MPSEPSEGGRAAAPAEDEPETVEPEDDAPQEHAREPGAEAVQHGRGWRPTEDDEPDGHTWPGG